ncbi:MAG TPA: vWA domain-containing protein [Ktedonobacterales bacterium]
MGRIDNRRQISRGILVRLLLVVVALCLGLSPLAVVARPAGEGIVRAASAPAGHVTVIALDMSGSMGSNDPNGLRCSAANAYVDLSGPGDYVGVVGLDNTGPTGGAHQFPLAQVWAQPTEMATVAARQQLHDTIATRSHNCRPDSATPTYDALQQSLTMLINATAQTHLPGSVILLTDGVPAPQQNEQISAIQQDLVPQFKQHDFPIDTVALGADGTLRSFLSDLANATGGTYYDDGHGVVNGVSPLNIAPFFVDIFARRNGRTVTHDIPPTTLSGGTVSRNFSIGNFVSHLDVVAVKDSPSTRVTLTAPNGRVLPPAVAGTFIATDPHYVIFSVDHPQSGAWQLNVSGSGRFLMDSLKLSTLGLSILSPDSATPLPLGQPLTISATLNDNGTPITGSRYSMNGTITYSGGTGSYTQEFVLDDHASPGTYAAQITVPGNAPTGAYAITINAREVSDTITSASRSVRIENFPAPLLVAPSTSKPTTATISTTVTQWDPALRALYGIPFGLLTWLSQWPLQGHPVVDSARLDGVVQLNGKPYTDASVSGSATLAGSKVAIPLRISSGESGHFTAAFTPASDGQYALAFKTSGSFKDSHGDLGTTTRAVTVRTQSASLPQEAIAWAITLLYLFMLIVIALLIRYTFAQKPFGQLVSNEGGGGEEFVRAHRGVYGLLHPGTVLSQQMGLDPGLTFRFHRGGRITVAGSGSGRRAFRLGGDPVPTSAVSASESILTTDEGMSYTVSASGSDASLDEEEGARRGGLLRRKPASDEYDDYETSGRRGLFGRRRREDDAEDDYDDDRRARRKTRRSRDDYDDDDGYSSSARSRRTRRRDDDEY